MNLAPYLSFGNSVECENFIEFKDISDLHRYFVDSSPNEYLVLGGGSNMLFVNSKTELDVLLMSILGKELVLEREEYNLVEISAGENWHDLVLWSLDKGYGGLENLSLIPGTVGAAPIQNIGAYGVELKDVLHSVNVYDIKEKRSFVLHNSECGFAYRDSIFKSFHKGKFIITGITLKLRKKNFKINAGYGAISAELEKRKISNPSPKDISNVVIEIRQTKLPDPKVLGNSGSFFKNPIVDKSILQKIKTNFENVPNYPVDENQVKLPAGWLIEQAGWKGKQIGNVGCHKNQALVIVNYGAATGQEIWNHALRVQDSVNKQFGIELTPEVNLIKK